MSLNHLLILYKVELMARGIVASKTVDYPDSDGLPMAESESQFWPILYVGAALDCYFQARDDVYVVGNLLLYHQEGDDKKSYRRTSWWYSARRSTSARRIGYGKSRRRRTSSWR